MSAERHHRRTHEKRHTVAQTPEPPLQLRELTLVRLKQSAINLEGRKVAAGSLGTIVGIRGGGRGYDVEVAEPVHGLVTLSADLFDVV